MRPSYVFTLGLAAITNAAPVKPVTDQNNNVARNNNLDVTDTLSKLGLPGDLVDKVVNSLPVDVKVDAPVLPEKREPEPAVEVDLGGGGLSVKREPEPAVEVDLGGGGLSVKREAAPAVEVDLGGGGLSV